MKMQSAIEFLASYAFLFIIMTVAILVIAVIIIGARTYVPSQCLSLGDIDCNYVSYYANQSLNYSLITLQLSNSQGVPINVSSIYANVGNGNYTGACSPNFVYPGEGTTCVINITSLANINPLPNPGYVENGQYTINALECDLGVGSLSTDNCTSRSYFGGTFVTTVVNRPAVIFSVLAAVGPSSNQLVPYSAISPPFVPANYVTGQNGEWETDLNGNDIGYIAYDYATSGYLPGSDSTTGTSRQSFPSDLSLLSNNYVAGTAPYNSVLSMAYTVIYYPKQVYDICAGEDYFTFQGLNAKTKADADMELYYKPASSTTWKGLFGGSGWSASSTPQTYSATNTFSTAGLYDIAVVWINPNSMGLQALNVTLYTTISSSESGCSVIT